MEGFLLGFLTKNACKKRNAELYEKLTKHCVGARFFDVGSCSMQPKIIKNRSKIACFLGHRFRMDFGMVLGGLGQAKILDFRTFFEVFSMSFLKSVSEEQKISPRDSTRRRMRNPRRDARSPT